MDQKRVDCGEHGEGWPILVCQHLFEAAGLEYCYDPTGPYEQWHDSWCEECDAYFQKNPDWVTEPDTAQRFRVVCHRCYESIIARHK